MDGDLAAWLALGRTAGVGPRSFARVLQAFPDPAAALAASAAARRQAGLPEALAKALEQPDWQGAEADLAWLAASPRHHLLRLGQPGYPSALAELADPPPLLFVVGDPAAPGRPQIALVGSRNATAGGLDNAWEFARHLAAGGLAVTSGLALGVDAAAHRGALAAGGVTLAVMGTGPDRVYPAGHRELAREVAAAGALVSEFPPGTPVRREHFPRRNRIISGLALGVLVVEAGRQSGSLVTARHALEQDREVFAIPGSIHNPLARGCHALIRQGAKLVESAGDLLEELPPTALAQAPGPAPEPAPGEALESPLDAEYQGLLEALGHDAVPLETLLQRTGLTPEKVSSMLLILELRGFVTACPGGRYARLGQKA